jgi:hypothetical protein
MDRTMYAAMKLARTMHRLSAVTQNQPLRVEIKGFKTGNYLGVKTTLVGPITAGREGDVDALRMSLQPTVYS